MSNTRKKTGLSALLRKRQEAGDKKKIASIAKRRKKEEQKKIRGASWFKRCMATLLLLCIVTLAVCADYLFSGTVELTAYIEPVKGGYSLTYPSLTREIELNDKRHIGDTFKVKEDQYLSGGIKMTVDSEEEIDGHRLIRCSFAVTNVPTMLTTDEYVELYETTDIKATNKIVSKAVVTGRVVFGRFVQDGIELQ